MNAGRTDREADLKKIYNRSPVKPSITKELLDIVGPARALLS